MGLFPVVLREAGEAGIRGWDLREARGALDACQEGGDCGHRHVSF